MPPAAPAPRSITEIVPPDLAAVLVGVRPHPQLGDTGSGRHTPATLSGIARELAARESAWRGRVRFTAPNRHAALVAADATHEAWLLCWLPGQHTGTHDHAGSLAALCVVRGQLELTARRAPADRPAGPVSLRAGQVRVIGSGDVHQVRNQGPEPALSIHVYAPRRVIVPRH
jgi:mannose-6-phosphate isomerase-like protein (cupin superfamily)